MAINQEPLADFWITGVPVGRDIQPIKLHGARHMQIVLKGPAKKYQQRIRAKVRQEWDKPPITTPVALVMVAFMPIPQSWSLKKQREMDGKLAPVKPDATNIFKLAEDAIVGSKNERLVLHDDAAVVKAYCEKRYAQRDVAGLSIKVYRSDLVVFHTERTAAR